MVRLQKVGESCALLSLMSSALIAEELD